MVWVEQELDEFTGRINEFQNNHLNEEEANSFKARRLMQGVYGQRQPGEQMMRIKIPGGALSSEQLKMIADITKKTIRTASCTSPRVRIFSSII